jgi:D-alanyl-D-alanine endopeptidase (penicillin-binding protein 7)
MKKFIVAIIMALINTYVVAGDLQAKSWLVADSDGKVIMSENIDVVQPIASITKLMTVMVVLDSKQDLNEKIKLNKTITTTRHKLIDLAVVHSDNNAANLLCKNYQHGYQSCILAMNSKARELGMTQTVFADSTGLNNNNVSSPTDLIKLLQAAEQYQPIVQASNQSSVNLQRKKKRKMVNVRLANTNPLVNKYNVIVSKTGYVRASGGCVIMSAFINGKKKLFVVLNSKTTKTRIHDMEKLIGKIS